MINKDTVQHLWKTLTTPRATDADDARREHMTRVISLIMGLVSLILVLVFGIGWVINLFPFDSLFIVLAMVLLFGSGWWLSFRGHWRIAGMIPPAIIFLTAVYGSYIGGAGAPAMVLYALAIVLAAILQGEQVHWITLILSIACYAGISTAQMAGYIRPLRSVETAFPNRVVIFAGTLSSITALLWFLVKQFKHALAQAHAYAQELSQRTDELMVANRQLEQEIAERIRAEQIRQQAEESLANERNLLRTLIDLLPDSIYAKDTSGRKMLANRVDVQYMGMQSETEVLGKTDLDTYSPDIAAQFMAADKIVIDTGQPVLNQEELITTGDGQQRWLLTSKVPLHDSTGQIIGLVGVGRDITERKQAQEEKETLQAQFLQAQKMEAIGRLAGGVAHDFNNHLTAIIGYADLLLAELDENDPKCQDIKEIKKAANRSAALTSQLLAFSRRQVIRPILLNLNETVVNMENMLHRLIGEDIDLQIRSDPSLGQVNADPGQIEQVVMNLAINARDAMPDGGKLTIEISNIRLDESYHRRQLVVESGSYVMLAVTDNGLGMDEETQSHLFEPFFTTKGVGKGTGLGLATVYGIVKQNNGYVWVYSEPGKGSTFKIYLPRIEKPAELTARSGSEAHTLRGTESLLLVEDEDAVRALARRTLQQYGYAVLEAHDAYQAMELSEHHPGAIHMLITDVVMPGGMNGRQLADKLRTLRPQTRVLFMSGYTDNAIVHHGVLDPGVNLIQKPFTPDALARRVRDVLDSR